MRAQRLALLGGIALAIALTPALAATVLAAGPTVVVQPGDTLTGIARRHSLSISRLVELNDLTDPNRIFAGQRLRVAGGGSRTPARAQTSTRRTVHVVSSGSTLWGIAAHYGVSVGSIAAANHLANPSLIFAGQRLVDPRRPDAPALPAPRGCRRRCLGTAAGSVGRARRQSRIDAVGHRRALRRERRIHCRGEPSRRSEPDLRRPAPSHSRWKRADATPRLPGRGCHRRWPAIVAERAAVRRIIVREARSLRRPAGVRAGGGLAGIGLAAGRREPRRRGRRHAADARDRRLGRRDDARPARGHPRGAEQHRRRRAAAEPLSPPVRRES